jgi:serine/threonine protein kinase
MQVQEKVRMVDGGVTYKTYTKVKDIGSGSFSKVWLVEAVGSNKLFALKIITKKQLKIL